MFVQRASKIGLVDFARLENRQKLLLQGSSKTATSDKATRNLYAT